MWGRFAPEGVSHYAASKFALEAANDSFRREFFDFDVHVSVIEPGYHLTPLLDGHEDHMRKLYRDLPTETKNLYGDSYLQGILQALERMKFGASNPDNVVIDIVHAMIAVHPKPRYVVGFDARYIFVPLSFLPTEIGDKIYRFIARPPTPEGMRKRKEGVASEAS